MTPTATTLARRYNGASVVITGAAGFIGSHLTRRLTSYGAHVTALVRTPVSSLQSPVSTHDIRHPAAMTSLLDDCHPDYAFHLAAYSGQVPSFTDHSESLTTNCLGLLNVLDAIRTVSPRTRLILPSSRLVYGRTRYLPVDEDHPRGALSLYGIHKRTGEEYCEYYAARWGVESVVLRIANPYGPHDLAGHNRYNIANWMIDEVIAGNEVTVFGRGDQLRDYIYIDDCLDAMLVAAVDPSAVGRIYNVGSGNGVALIDFVRAAIAAAGSGSVRFADWPPESLAVETGDFIGDITRIRNDLAWAPNTTFAAGIAATVAAQRAALASADVPDQRTRRRPPAISVAAQLQLRPRPAATPETGAETPDREAA